MKKIIYIILGLLAILSVSGCTNKTGSGMSVDTIAGIEQDGLICSTWSVWLTNDHPSGTKGETGYYSAIYSVDKDNTALINQIKLLAGTNKKVKIYYDNLVFQNVCSYSSDVLITKIELID